MSEKEHKGYHQPPKPLTEAEKKALTGLDDLRDDRSKPQRRLGCLLRMFTILLVVGGVVGAVQLVLWWHPWRTESTQVPITSDLCTDGEHALQFREQFFVLGYEVSDKNKGVVCVSNE